MHLYQAGLPCPQWVASPCEGPILSVKTPNLHKKHRLRITPPSPYMSDGMESEKFDTLLFRLVLLPRFLFFAGRGGRRRQNPWYSQGISLMETQMADWETQMDALAAEWEYHGPGAR